MEIVVKTGQFLLSLSILVILHEMGHFFFAKLFKTKVEKFYLFFDPWFSIFKFKKGETEYGIGWLPLGGYVKISGMIDESMDKEQLKLPAQPWEFRAKPTWQRLLIMIGGVLVNFLLAMFIYSMMLFTWGDEYLPNSNVKYGVMCDSLALNAGFQNGDKIISVDSQKIEDFGKIVGQIVLNNAKLVQVERNGELVNIQMPEALIRELIKAKRIGFLSPRTPFTIGEFDKTSAAKDAGLKKGDKIVQFAGKKVDFFDEFKSEIGKHKNESVEIGVLRGKDSMMFNIQIPSTALIGVMPGWDENLFETNKINYSFFASFPAGIHKGISTVSDYLKQFKLLFDRKTKAYESLGGFITIGKIFPSVWDWQKFWNLTAFLSIILAVMNILPIPALDGGHVLFLLYEIVTGRKPSDKFLEYAQIAGMVLLFSLLIYANGNDIVKLFHK